MVPAGFIGETVEALYRYGPCSLPALHMCACIPAPCAGSRTVVMDTIVLCLFMAVARPDRPIGRSSWRGTESTRRHRDFPATRDGWSTVRYPARPFDPLRPRPKSHAPAHPQQVTTYARAEPACLLLVMGGYQHIVGGGTKDARNDGNGGNLLRECVGFSYSDGVTVRLPCSGRNASPVKKALRPPEHGVACMARLDLAPL
jgi:hypothetical protein